MREGERERERERERKREKERERKKKRERERESGVKVIVITSGATQHYGGYVRGSSGFQLNKISSLATEKP